MLRNVVGLAVHVAAGKADRAIVSRLLAPGASTRADFPARAAPANGLCLDRVLYDDF